MGNNGREAEDLILQITFNLEDRNKSIIVTNARKEVIEEVLEDWLSSQAGLGKDNSEANEKSEYKIEIQVDLSSDTFYTNSDTGNKGLTCGIIMDLLDRLNDISILELEKTAG